MFVHPQPLAIALRHAARTDLLAVEHNPGRPIIRVPRCANAPYTEHGTRTSISRHAVVTHRRLD